jgi:hypothetical protein
LTLSTSLIRIFAPLFGPVAAGGVASYGRVPCKIVLEIPVCLEAVKVAGLSRGIRRPQTLTLDTRQEQITLSPFTDGALTATFSTSADARVEIRDGSGVMIEASEHPLAEFPPYTDAVKWGPHPADRPLRVRAAGG